MTTSLGMPSTVRHVNRAKSQQPNVVINAAME